MSRIDPWNSIIKQLKNPGGDDKDVNPIEPQWFFYYDDGHRKIMVDHKEAELEEILRMFEDFCKGCGFVFDGFGIVDEDGIPVNGLNPLAKLEAGNRDEDTTGK
jgi:hypothetical protein